MIIVMKSHADPKDVEGVVKRVEELGYKIHLSRGEARTIIGVIGADEHLIANSTFEVMDGVERTMRVMQPYKMASRDFSASDTVIDVRGVPVGGKRIVVMAGPCSVESREMILETAQMVKRLPAPRSCAAARSSRAPARTVSRDWAKKASSIWPRRAN